MRASQLRDALLCARRYLRVAASACALGLLLNACGGNDSADTSTNASLPVTISGADGASVSLRALPRAAKNQATVRVARDGTGAPLLGGNYTPLGAVYQFTPLGWIEEAIEIRVPFAGTETAIPRLLIAQPGGHWMEVAGARRQGNFMVARVPQLAYATVVASTADTTPSGRLRALAAHIAGTEAAEPLQLSVDEQTTVPALPVADTENDPEASVVVIANTSLGLKLQYDLPTGCTVPPVVSTYASVWLFSTEESKLVQLGSNGVPSNTGSASYTVPISASDSGFWVFSSIAMCTEPGTSVPRYMLMSAGPAFVVDIDPTSSTPPPSITNAPQDANVVEGSTASFGVTAEGDALAYEWQRSNDGGATYAPASAANAPSYSLTTALADNNALFRVKVSNANGSTTSTPAKLTVSQKVIAPTVTSDPANQTVIEGETASFSVSGSGQPVPTVQWQQRAVANADPEAGWADIAGATNTTYTTPATTLSQSGAQYRVLLRNAGGVAATLPATLVVNAQVIAPTIVTAPQSLSVTAGQFGALAVTASGTSPLSYQWFKNGQAIAGANASEILVLADPADLGGSYEITVQVSNSAGSVLSSPAVLNVIATVPANPGTLIKAGEAGVVQVGDDASLVVPAGALTSDTVIAIGQQAQATVALPAGFTAMSDAYDITPAGLVFASPAVLNVPAPDTLPEGTVLALVELASTSNPLGVNRVAAASVNLRQLALGRAAGNRRTLAAVSSVSNVLCTSAQNSRGGSVAVNLLRAARYVTAAVSESACQGVAPAPSNTLIPSTSTAPCTENEFVPVEAGSQAALQSRHVSCVKYGITGLSFYELPSVPPNGAQASYGVHTLEWRVGSDGPAKGLNKTYRLSFRLTQTETGTTASALTLNLRPAFRCDTAVSDPSASCTHDTPSPISVTAGSGWSTARSMVVNFNWGAGDNTWTEFNPSVAVKWSLPGQDVSDLASLPSFDLNGAIPVIRCDKKIADGTSNGCVYPNAPAVLVLSIADARVKEAAEHVRDAQNAGSLGGLDIMSNGQAIASSGKALQRTQVTGLKGDRVSDGANRNNACTYVTSIIKVRPEASTTCSVDGSSSACSCDEYPFNSTWNGAFLNRDGTSARYVNLRHNVEAGSRTGRFYQAERVLDYTPDPGISYNIGNEAQSIPMRLGGDDFWVHIE